jgi:sucrose-6F-phosphate phosphohydrolase
MPPPRLLVSDVDDTLLGDRAAAEEFAAWYETARGEMRLVYASGRFVDSIIESIRSTPLPEPDAIIGGVGSEIRRYPSRDPFGDWQERMSENWNADKVQQLLADEPDLERQPEKFQSDYKQSYFLYDAPQERLDQLQKKLAEGDLAAHYIYSSRRDLDFLPSGVNKGTAAAFLAKYWDLSPDNVLVSGNSANDADLFQQGFLGVVVANGHDELKALQSPRVYLARRGYAAGVMEGIRHWSQAKEP